MSWLSGGVLFAVGAVLWAAYLLPSLLRRRNERAVELEASELQAALHTLAETGELPEGALSTREHLNRAKQFDREERRIERDNLRALREAEHERKRAERDARHRERLSAAHQRAELVRLRMVAAWVLLLAVLTCVGGVVAVFFGVTWIVAGGGAVVAMAAVVTLRDVARRIAALDGTAAVLHPGQPVREFALTTEPRTESASRAWQPRDLPTPLHLASGSAASATIAASDALEALRRRAREIAAESAEPTLPSVTAARARAAAIAAHPSSYGQRMRARLNASVQVRAAVAAAVPAPVLSRAEQVAARVVANDVLSGELDVSLDVSAVLQRRRVG